jgi:hypothetical protein
MARTRKIKPSKNRYLGMNKGVYDKLDSADQKAYKNSLYSGYINKFKGFRDIHKGDRPRPLPKQPYDIEKIRRGVAKQEVDPNGFIGSGLAGLGQNELKRRVEQHNALAKKAFERAGGGEKETLTTADVSNVYRGIQLQNRAKAMKALNDPKIFRNKK